MSEISQRPGNLTLSGNLTVNGTTTTVNSTAINVNNQIVFEGATANESETTLTVVDPTADRTITFPDASGTVAFIDSPTFTGTVTLPSGQALIAPALGTPSSGVADNMTTNTETAGNNTNQIASTAFVTAAVAAGVVTASADAILEALIDAKGDLIVGVANDTPARLAVGINGYFLKADTAAENGLAWAAIPTVSILDDVGDVTLTAIANGEFLKWNGTVWINSAVDLSVKANIASPTFTGVPAADTAAEGTNTTQLATTAFTIANRISPADNMFLSMVFR